MPKKIEQAVEIKDLNLLQELIENFTETMPVLLDENTEIVISKDNVPNTTKNFHKNTNLDAQ